MDVEFINDVLLCRCSCCEFKQWVKPRNHPKPREDCRYWDAATQTWQNVAYYGPGGPPANSQFVCPGDRPLDGEKAGIREEAVGTIWVSDCIVKFEDEPASEVMTLESIKKYVRYDATFYGVIIDTCNNNVVRDWAKFKIDFKSKAGKFAWGAEWDGDLTKKPVIFEKIADHDSVPVADKEKPTQYRGAGKVAAIPPPRGWLE